MSGRKLLFYLAVLVLVVGGYGLSEYYQSRQAAQEKADKLIFQVKSDDIQAITLKSDKGEIHLTKVAATPTVGEPATAAPAPAPIPPSAPQWQLTKPVVAPTDHLTMTSLVSALVDLKVERRLDEAAPERLKEFGLDKPIFTLEFQAGGQTRQLRFGQKVPGSQHIYAQRDDDAHILVLRQADKETLDRTLTALRAKEIFSLKPQDITELRVIRPQERLVIKKDQAGTWTPAAPLQVKLREDKVTALLSQLAQARAVEFVAEKAEDLKKYGLAPTPTLRLTLRRDEQEETLLIGGQQGERAYAQVSGKAPIFLVDKQLVEKLPKSIESFEDRRLWTGSEKDVQKIVWGTPPQQQTAVRQQDGWSIQTGGQQTVLPAPMQINIVLWRLQELEFNRLLKNAAGPEAAPALFTIQLFGPDDALLWRLSEYPGEKDQVKVVATSGDSSRTATVASQTFAELKGLLDRLAAPPPKDQEKHGGGS